MSRVHTWLAVSLLAFASVGCVSQEKYAAVTMDRDQLAQRLTQTEREKSEAVAGRDLLQRQLDKIGLGTDQKDALILNQTQQIANLEKELAEINRRYADAARNVGAGVTMLPAPLNEALQQFAAAYPDLVEFDANRGMVKFKSDVTFSAGSAELKPTAASAIDRFAGILNSPAALGYELMVVGHTDNVPVSHEATRKAGHLNNWYLSAHRAIAVSAELQRQSVSSARLEVAGCADQRPIASNTSEAGKAQNRRVEVLILPTMVRGSVAAAPAPSAPVAHPAGLKMNKAELNKDFNKDVPERDTKKTVFNK